MVFVVLCCIYSVNVLNMDNLPECLIEKSSSRLAPFSFIQAVVEQTRVAFHCICFLKHSIDKIVGVDVILDEVIEGQLQFGGKGQQNPAEQTPFILYRGARKSNNDLDATLVEQQETKNAAVGTDFLWFWSCKCHTLHTSVVT